MGDYASYFDNFDSMEKLWFAFIMLEKYKKQWKEEEWGLYNENGDLYIIILSR